MPMDQSVPISNRDCNRIVVGGKGYTFVRIRVSGHTSINSGCLKWVALRDINSVHLCIAGLVTESMYYSILGFQQNIQLLKNKV